MSVAAPRVGTDFRVGDVLSRGFAICMANFPFFFAITFVVSLPNLLFLLSRDPLDPAASLGWRLWVSIAAIVVLSQIGQAIILFGAFQQLRGQPLNPGEAFARALARFFPLLGLAILYGLGIMLGMVLLIVPGIILLVMWAVAVPACVVEGLGPVASLRRSRELTKGHRWKVFALYLLLLIVTGAVNWLVGRLLAPAGTTAAAFATVIWSAAWGVFWHCVIIMTYHDLRVAKEGISSEQLASVFD